MDVQQAVFSIVRAKAPKFEVGLASRFDQIGLDSLQTALVLMELEELCSLVLEDLEVSEALAALTVGDLIRAVEPAVLRG